MLSISNEELKHLPSIPDGTESFEIIHTHPDGTAETCAVKPSKSESGETTWAMGGYTTKEGKTFLAVLAGKILDGIQLKQ
jgi:hypothetical protein